LMAVTIKFVGPQIPELSRPGVPARIAGPIIFKYTTLHDYHPRE
jgi:hypothetical protein